MLNWQGEGTIPALGLGAILAGQVHHAAAATGPAQNQTTGIRNSHLTRLHQRHNHLLPTMSWHRVTVRPVLRQDDPGFDGQSIERVEDYAYGLGIKGRTANEISADEPSMC